jgi:O-antigen ligase
VLQTENPGWSAVVIAEICVVLFIFVASLMLFLFEFRRSRGRGAPTTVKFVSLYTVLAAFSLTYTAAPLYSGFYFLRLLSAVLLLGVYFDSANDSQVARFAHWTCLAVTPYVFFPWIELIALKAVSEHRPGGLYVQTSMASTIGYAVALFFLCSWLENRRSAGTLGLGVLALSSAYLAGGKTSAAAMVAVLLLVFTANRRKILKARGVGAVLFACVVLAPLAAGSGVGLLAHAQEYSQGDFGTWTGRVELWHTAVALWSNARLLGYGLASINLTWISAPHANEPCANNSYLQALLEVGVLGSLPLFAAIGTVLLRTLRLGIRAFRVGPLGPTVAAWGLLLLCSVTEVVFGCPTLPVDYLFLGLLVCADAFTRPACPVTERLTRDRKQLLWSPQR